MLPYSSHSDGDYYWESANAVMVSFTEYGRNQSRSPFIVGTENVKVNAIFEDGNVSIAIFLV